MGEDTTFLERATAAGKKSFKSRTIVAGGTGLSAAAVIWIYASFATKADLERQRQSQAAQWQRITQMQAELNELKSGNLAYARLLEFVTTGRINASVGVGKTN